MGLTSKVAIYSFEVNAFASYVKANIQGENKCQHFVTKIKEWEKSPLTSLNSHRSQLIMIMYPSQGLKREGWDLAVGWTG